MGLNDANTYGLQAPWRPNQNFKYISLLFFFFLPKVLFLCKTLFLFCKLTSFLSYYRYIIVVFLIFHLLTRYYAFVIIFFFISLTISEGERGLGVSPGTGNSSTDAPLPCHILD